MPIFAPYGTTPWLCSEGYANVIGEGERGSIMRPRMRVAFHSQVNSLQVGVKVERFTRLDRDALHHWMPELIHGTSKAKLILTMGRNLASNDLQSSLRS